MTFLTLLIIWYSTGLVCMVGNILLVYYLNDEDITLEDISVTLVVSLFGPFILAWTLLVIMTAAVEHFTKGRRFKSIIVFKSRKPKQ